MTVSHFAVIVFVPCHRQIGAIFTWPSDYFARFA